MASGKKMWSQLTPTGVHFLPSGGHNGNSRLRVTDSRNRILITLGFLAIYLVAGHIPVPRINRELLLEFFNFVKESECTVQFEFASIYTIHNPMHRLSIVALGIGPYVIAWVILLLFPVVWLHLYRLYTKGGVGRSRIAQYAWYLAFLLSVFQSFAISRTLHQQSFQGTSFVDNPGFLSYFTIGVTITAGFSLAMWLADQITHHGVGYGIPLLIIASIVVNLVQVLTGACF